MPLALLCDENIPFPVIDGLNRRGIDAATVQQSGMRSASDKLILEAARQQGRVVFTNDADFLRHHATAIGHSAKSTTIPLITRLVKPLDGFHSSARYSLQKK